MATRTEAYVDTSALIALLDASDSFHSLFRVLFATPPRLVTSALVIAEGHGWFLRRYDSRRAIQFLNFVNDLSALQSLPFGPKEWDEVGRVVRKFSDQSLTLADAHGLTIMEQRGISDCWSTDRRLTLRGARLAISPDAL